MSPVARSIVRKLAALAVLAALWEATARLFPAWPGPFVVGRVLMENLGDAAFRQALGGSLRRMIIGYLFVVAIGVSAGMLLGRFRLLDELMGSVAVAIHAIPGAAWVPLSVLWFGLTEQAVVFTILLGATGVVMVSTDSGIKDVPPQIVRAARTLGASGTAFFWHVVIPAATPKILDGLRLAWAFGWRALMAGELIISVSGLGELLNVAARGQQVDQLLAIMLLIAGIGMAVDGFVFKRLDRLVRVRWGLAS
ncbi:MAG TPA: ABC transporter permease [bacterium]